MMKRTELSKAVAYAATGAIVAMASISDAAASATFYNTYNAYASNIVSDSGDGATDGWTNQPTSGWSSGSAPFGATSPVVNWAAEITAGGDALTISSQDAHDRYGVWADVDTAKGAWQDSSTMPTGWAHNTDVGLFRSAVDSDVTVKVTALQVPGSTDTWNNFGISLYSGMSEGTWDHHSSWNCPTCAVKIGGVLYPDPIPYDQDNPLGSTGLTYLAHDATVDAINGFTFHASAGQVYSILLGGASGMSYYGPHAGYSVNITTSAVPLPGVGWLLGGALAGLVSAQRRKRPTR